MFFQKLLINHLVLGVLGVVLRVLEMVLVVLGMVLIVLGGCFHMVRCFYAGRFISNFR